MNRRRKNAHLFLAPQRSIEDFLCSLNVQIPVVNEAD